MTCVPVAIQKIEGTKDYHIKRTQDKQNTLYGGKLDSKYGLNFPYQMYPMKQMFPMKIGRRTALHERSEQWITYYNGYALTLMITSHIMYPVNAKQ